MTDDLTQQITNVQIKYTDELMGKANVMGLGVGFKRINGKMTEKKCLVVLVDHKVPIAELAPEDVVPRSLDGVVTDVQETGGQFFAG